MAAVVARQPILDKNKNVFAYELLFRGGDTGTENFDGDKATAQVISNTLESIGFKNLTEGKPAFINFTDKLLKQGIPDLLNPENVYLEVLENVKVDSHLLYVLKTYKDRGFKIVLDDFIFSKNLISLVELADFIKIDFLAINGAERKNIIESCQIYNPNLKFLGEKIETHADYMMAVKMGYCYFQGYFFTKPEIIQTRESNSYEFSFFKMMEELNKEEPEFKTLEEIVRSDFSMSYSLLRIINSAHFGYDVKSIRQAIVLLGVDKLRKWSLLYFLKGLNSNKPDVLFKTAVLRANFAESLSEYFSDDKSNNLFVLGLLSVIDGYLDRDIADVLEEISLFGEFKQALISKEGKLGDLLSLIESFEKLNFKQCQQYLEGYSLDYDIISRKYINSLEKSEEIIKAFENY
ncbi:EAL and modified HD-GYP domain-containing signal transduction protein [Halanaerobium saccharolyticum]|uniref:EAL and modified HD-GYP domain-containing signal transduction protein n=1 Tax=Halanaerobium saccharolyticum TaxID=43595 RepID=A0A2T5RJY5_9FIRM|nr:HDOD domain-containing protein [Halanaerobium saccharolyticum]PTV99096.1 EAL and modified HD-GYP domain-containing signal transduction protein [Halanaerobium saccharolyticum]